MLVVRALSQDVGDIGSPYLQYTSRAWYIPSGHTGMAQSTSHFLPIEAGPLASQQRVMGPQE